MKQTIDYVDNIMDIVYVCRKKNKKIGARIKHFYLDKNTMMVQLSGKGPLVIPLLIAENGVSQMAIETIQKIADSFEEK